MMSKPITHIPYNPLKDESDWVVGTEDKGMRYAVRRKESFGTVCMLPYGLRPEEKALATLLAAAPEMVTALQTIARLSEGNWIGQIAEAAIEKATLVKE
jgi:hypothetical protein